MIKGGQGCLKFPFISNNSKMGFGFSKIEKEGGGQCILKMVKLFLHNLSSLVKCLPQLLQ